MFYLIPPAGTRIGAGDFFKILGSRINAAAAEEALREKISARVQVRHSFFFNSGRSALVFILKALSNLSKSGRTEVVIPAYTCFTVPAAIAKSGLKIRLVDIKPETMDYDYARLFEVDFSQVLAVMGCNLFGIWSDWGRLRTLAKDKDVYLIDDAAQSMGTMVEGNAAGNLGDVGLFSLGRGKNMSTYSGGIAVTNNDELAAEIGRCLRRLPRPRQWNEMILMSKFAAYALFLNPRIYWLPARLPFLRLGETIFDTEFGIHPLTRSQICAANTLIDNLANYNVVRTANARKLAIGLMVSRRFLIPGCNEVGFPSYLRLPVLAEDITSRDRMIINLRKQGIVASKMYPSTIRKIAGIEKYLAASDDYFPGSQMIVDRLLSLPTHPFVTDADIQRMIACLTG
jgi:dTDP-4-amino-4,6-dideoxygalactose transaminase